MLFCSSFIQSERFLQTDQLITRLQVVVVTNFIRMLMRNVFVNVFTSDAVIWCAAIFRMLAPLLHPADVKQDNARKLEVGVGGFALVKLEQVMQRPMWEMISPLLALDGVVKLCTAGNHWNNGSMSNSSLFRCRTVRTRVPGEAQAHRSTGMSSHRSRNKTLL